MEQKPIRYIDVINLGFTIEEGHDNVFFETHGYPYQIIEKSLCKGNILALWCQEKRTVELMHLKSKKNGEIKSRLRIKDLEHLKQMIEFLK